MSLFAEDKISDQKRLARGEQWLHTRTLLRSFYRVHNAPWRILTLAGAAPQGEFKCIRELMPLCKITAVDNDEQCILEAQRAGADETILADLSEEVSGETIVSTPLSKRTFDVINLDLCSGAIKLTRDLIRIYAAQLASPGVLMTTFCYGRDVVEFFNALSDTTKDPRILERAEVLEQAGISSTLIKRIRYLFPTKFHRISSIILYQGHAMPMCSIVVPYPGVRGKFAVLCSKVPSIVRLAGGDFENLVLHPDVSLLYDCPAERIQTLRKREIALKAIATRKVRELL
jgi:hypothetical protein